MCTIDFNVVWEDLDSGLIFAHEGQYRKVGSPIWIPFNFDLDNPKTPYITEIGDYQMRIRIFDGQAWSEWFISQFQIGCGAFTTGYDTGYDS